LRRIEWSIETFHKFKDSKNNTLRSKRRRLRKLNLLPSKSKTPAP
jgi:hypothetical protein